MGSTSAWKPYYVLQTVPPLLTVCRLRRRGSYSRTENRRKFRFSENVSDAKLAMQCRAQRDKGQRHKVTQCSVTKCTVAAGRAPYRDGHRGCICIFFHQLM